MQERGDARPVLVKLLNSESGQRHLGLLLQPDRLLAPSYRRPWRWWSARRRSVSRVDPGALSQVFKDRNAERMLRTSDVLKDWRTV
jgi:hypothetical protein